MVHTSEREISVGLTHKKVFTVSVEDLSTFRCLTGDTHTIHSDNRGIVFGAVTWGFVSCTLTEMLGDNYVCESQHGTFLTPLLVGHEAVIQLTITEMPSRQKVRVTARVYYATNSKRIILTGYMDMRPLL